MLLESTYLKCLAHSHQSEFLMQKQQLDVRREHEILQGENFKSNEKKGKRPLNSSISIASSASISISCSCTWSANTTWRN